MGDKRHEERVEDTCKAEAEELARLRVENARLAQELVVAQRRATVVEEAMAERQREGGAPQGSEAPQSRQRQFVEMLLDQLQACVAVMKGRELRYTLVNRAYQALRPEMAMLGRTYRQVFPGAAAAGAEGLLQEVIETGVPREDHGYHAPIPGKPDAAWDHRVVRLPVVGGEEPSVLVITWDVTEHKRFQEALRAERDRAQRYLDLAGAIFVALDAEGRVALLNRRGSDVLGLTANELTGKDWFETALPERDRARVRAAFLQIMRGELAAVEYFENPVVTVNGEERLIAWHNTLLRDESGRISGTLSSGEDITERKRMEASLRETNEQLREANRRKNDYIAMLSHELRNPLAAISSAVDLTARRAGGDPLLRRAAEAAGRQVRNMARMLDGLLEMARITRGQVSLRRERVAIASVVQRGVETVNPKIEARRHQLSVSLPPAPLVVVGDPVRLAQVIADLLDNAAKFTPDGGRIAVAATQEGDEAVIRVRDTGRGIPPELLPHVFEVFERGEHAKGEAEGGLGLGLALARRLVEMHGGQVEAHSEGPGKGSEFIVRLPLPAGATARARRRVLLVEDNADAAELLAMTLETEGHEVVVAQ